MIFLCTDYRSSIYTGQVIARIASLSPQAQTVDLIDDLPAFYPKAGAYLLSAIVSYLPAQSVIVAVVDPGVGSDRAPICFKLGTRWFMGPDNGLLARIIGSTLSQVTVYQIDTDSLGECSTTFHGRDVFGPAAAYLHSQEDTLNKFQIDCSITQKLALQWPENLYEIVYIDGYGNGMTGISADSVDPASVIRLNGQDIYHAQKFADVSPDQGFWYKNSMGLLEIAINQGNAKSQYQFDVGSPVSLNLV